MDVMFVLFSKYLLFYFFRNFYLDKMVSNCLFLMNCCLVF